MSASALQTKVGLTAVRLICSLRDRRLVISSSFEMKHWFLVNHMLCARLNPINHLQTLDHLACWKPLL